MTTLSEVRSPSPLEEKLGYIFTDRALLDQALTHKSYRNERRLPVQMDNERLEFLGDSVLSLSLSQLLMAQSPEADEGVLSRRRAALVNEESLAQLALELGVAEQIKLGKGEISSGGASKPRLLASALEAILGGVLIESNFDTVSALIHKLFALPMARLETLGDFNRDFKTRLQEMSQKYWGGAPTYTLIKAEGPEHAKHFVIQVSVANVGSASGEGRSKKVAEQAAAQTLLETIDQLLKATPRLSMDSRASSAPRQTEAKLEKSEATPIVETSVIVAGESEAQI